jgi:hypothetical protein
VKDTPSVDRSWRAIDDGVLPYALALLRATWVWLLLHIWSAWLNLPADVLPAWVIGACLVLGTAAAQVGRCRLERQWQDVGLVTIGGLLVVAAGLQAGLGNGYAPGDARWAAAIFGSPLATLFTALVAGGLWAWGALAGRARLFYETYARNFAVGLVGLALAVAVGQGLPAGGALRVTSGQTLLAALAYFGLGLGTLAIASIQATRQSERRRSQQSFHLSRYWLGMVAAVVGALLLAGLALAQLFTPGVVQAILSGLGLVIDVLARLLLILIYVLSYPFLALADWLRRTLGPAKQPDRPQPLQPMPPLAEQFRDLQQPPPAVSPELYMLLRILAGVLIVAVAVLVFVLIYRRARGLFAGDEDEDETREMLGSAGLLRAQLADLFGRRPAANQPPPFAPIAGDDARARVRRTYQALLAWAVEQGVPRLPGLTPDEYAVLLGQARPVHRAPITVITDEYVGARYGLGPVSEESAARAARAWAEMSGSAASARV